MRGKSACGLTSMRAGAVTFLRPLQSLLDLPTVGGRRTVRNEETNVQSFKVTGMTCGHCVRAVTDAVRGVDGAAQVEVDLGAGRVTVRDGTAAAERIAAAIVAEGYTVEPTAAA